MRLLCFLALAGCADDRGPRLSSVAPAAAPRGALVMLTGDRLCGGDCETAAGEIQLGLELPTTIASVIEYDDDRAIIEIPSSTALGPTEIIVTVNDRSSNAIAFEVLAPP